LVAIGWVASRAQASQPLHRFDIPARPLAAALTAFARQADVTLLSSAGAVKGLRAPDLQGYFTVAQALRHLLAGTDLSFRLVSDSAIAIVPRPRSRSSGGAAGAGTLQAGTESGRRGSRLRAGARAGRRPREGLRPQPEHLAQVVVTATKRATTVQSTAASVTAITAAEIARRGWTDFDSLAQSIAGLAMRTAGPGQTEFEMRGLNSSGGNTSMVGLYLGEIPLSAPASAQLGKVVIDLDLYDLNRVEVLRGPQGTLYGASSMGGTIRLVPNPPKLKRFSAAGETIVSDTVAGGGLNRTENGMINLPLGGSAALRIAASLERQSGWIERRVIANGAVAVDSGTFPEVSRPANFYRAPLQERVNAVNTTEVDLVRASILWKPVRHLSILPLAMYQLTRQGAPDAVDVNGAPTHPVMPGIEAHWEIYATPEPQRDRFTLASLRLVYRLPAVRVISASGYWNRDTQVSQDATEETAASLNTTFPVYAGPAGLGPTGPAPGAPGASERDYTRQVSEELRVASTGSAALKWLAGWFYQDLHSRWDLWVLAPQAAAVLGGPNIYVDYQPQHINQSSQFGELSWRLSAQLTATLGLRHYHYSLSQSNREYGLFTVYGFEGNDVPYDTTASNGAQGTVPELGLKYTLDRGHMLYATVSKGFRLGGVNQPIPVAPAADGNAVLVGNECGLQEKLLGPGRCNPELLLQAPTRFRSDSVWSYELGEKSSFLRRRLTLDVSGYFERWLHPQLATNLAGFGITANGADARIEGLEAEMRALLGHDWAIHLDAGYTHARFVHGSALIGYPAGTAVPDIPSVTATADLHWRHDLSGALAAFASLEWDYVGSRTDAPYGETITLWNIGQYMVHLPAYSLANLRVGLAAGRWKAALFVDNVTNARVLLDPQPQVDLQTAAFTRYTVNPPLTAGVDLTWRLR
jgi:outer membrane receptor protein involved in Fe transport